MESSLNFDCSFYCSSLWPFCFFKYRIYSLNLKQQLRAPNHQEMQETFEIKTSNSEKQYMRRLTIEQRAGKKIPNRQQLWSSKSYGSKTSCPIPCNAFDYLFLLKTTFNHGSDTNGNTLSAVWLVIEILSALYHQDKVKVAKQSLTCRNCIQSTVKWCMCT